MAKRAAPELLSEARHEKNRQRNAEKQQRFRDTMKAEGYRRITLWDLPSPASKRLSGAGFKQVPAWESPRENPGKSRAAKVTLAVRIRESSLHVAARLPAVQKALAAAESVFLKALGDSPESRAVYNDYLELARVLDSPREDE